LVNASDNKQRDKKMNCKFFSLHQLLSKKANRVETLLSHFSAQSHCRQRNRHCLRVQQRQRDPHSNPQGPSGPRGPPRSCTSRMRSPTSSRLL
jgi:hypothetical protein